MTDRVDDVLGVPEETPRKCGDCGFVFARLELRGKPVARGYERYQCPRCGEVVFDGALLSDMQRRDAPAAHIRSDHA